MAIQVNGLAGFVCEVHGREGADVPVSELKRMIQRRTSIEPDEQRLLVEASPLFAFRGLLLHVPEDGVEITMINRSKEAARWLAQVRKSRQGKRIATAPEDVRNDAEIAYAALLWDVADLKHVDESLLEDRFFMLRAVSAAPKALGFAAPSVKEDLEVVLKAALGDPDTLRHATPQIQAIIRADKEFILAAIQKRPDAFQYASEELLADSDFVLRAVEKSPCVFEFVRKEHKANRGIVLAAVSQIGAQLQFADQHLRTDSEVIRASTKHSKCPSTAGIVLSR